MMIGDAALAGKMAEKMLERGVYVIGFSYPVMPQGKARCALQVSAAHTTDDAHLRSRRSRRCVTSWKSEASEGA